MKFALVFITVGLLLTGCSSPEVPAPVEPVIDAVMPSEASYIASSSDIPARGPFVLFFSKPSDPFSERSDKILRATYGSGAAKLTTYRLDLTSSTGARLKYGVFVEDTFIVVNGSGATQSIVHPTAQQIREIVKSGRILP